MYCPHLAASAGRSGHRVGETVALSRQWPEGLARDSRCARQDKSFPSHSISKPRGMTERDTHYIYGLCARLATRARPSGEAGSIT